MLQKGNMVLVLGTFFNEPTKNHYLKEISKTINLAHTSVKIILKYLIKQNLVLCINEKKGRRVFPLYKANINNKDFKIYKRLYNLLLIQESDLIKFLGDNLTPKSIVLFGSFSRGEDVEDSDIDLFIESSKTDLNLDKFEKLLGRKIELHFNENFTKYPAELKANIINGIVLYGYLEV